MHYHIDMITHGPPLLNQPSALVGTSWLHAGRSPPFCEIQTNRAVLNLDGPLHRQRQWLTIMLFPSPPLLVGILHPTWGASKLLTSRLSKEGRGAIFFCTITCNHFTNLLENVNLLTINLELLAIIVQQHVQCLKIIFHFAHFFLFWKENILTESTLFSWQSHTLLLNNGSQPAILTWPLLPLWFILGNGTQRWIS